MTNEYKKMHLAEFEVNHFELFLGVLSFCYKAASRWSESSSIHSNPALSNPLQPPVQSDELTQLKGDFVRLERFLTSKVEELEAAVTAALKNVVKRESLDQMSAVMHRVNKDIETLQKATEEMQRDLITLQKSVEAPSKPRKRLFPFTWRFASDHIIENDTQFQSQEIFSSTGHSFHVLINPDHTAKTPHVDKVVGIGIFLSSTDLLLLLCCQLFSKGNNPAHANKKSVCLQIFLS